MLITLYSIFVSTNKDNKNNHIMKTTELINTSLVPNFHILEVNYIGATDYKGSRIRIKSDRFNCSVVIPMNYDYNDIQGGALEWLKEHNFNVIGKGESKKGYYIITDTFDHLKAN